MSDKDIVCSMCTEIIDKLEFGIVIRTNLSDHVICKSCFKEELN